MNVQTDTQDLIYTLYQSGTAFDSIDIRWKFTTYPASLDQHVSSHYSDSDYVKRGIAAYTAWHDKDHLSTENDVITSYHRFQWQRQPEKWRLQHKGVRDEIYREDMGWFSRDADTGYKFLPALGGTPEQARQRTYTMVPLVNSFLTLPGYDFDIRDINRVAGREGIRAVAIWRNGTDDESYMFFGYRPNDVEVTVDTEYGTLLAYDVSYLGKPLYASRVVSVEFDKMLDDQLFELSDDPSSEQWDQYDES